MRHTALLLTVTAFTVWGASTAFAQADARQAYAAGKAAYAAGRFEEARDHFAAASRTDNRNPEVFLWLGKAHYQLGAVSEAMAAWRRTLALAPDEPFARQMLAALSAQTLKADVRVALVETMLAEKLHQAAVGECTDLLKQTTLSDAQRARVMTLLARATLGTGRASDALKTVHELQLRYPKLVDVAETTLLLGQARRRMGGEHVAAGIALLRKVAREHANTPAGATARYELILLELDRRPTPAAVASLQTWIADHATHVRIDDARRRLITSLLKLTSLSGVPKKDTALSAWDQRAIATATPLYGRIAKDAEARKLTQELTGHLDAHYAARGAHAAAIDGVTQLLKAVLPPAGRLAALRYLAGFQYARAVTQLTEQARRGQLKPGPLPTVAAEALATLQTIRREFPEDRGTWLDQALLARSIGELASMVPWPTDDTLKPPMTWAVALALPVVQSGHNRQAISRAIGAVNRVVATCRTLPGRRGLTLALDVNTRLVTTLTTERPEWPGTMTTQARLLDALAKTVFNENIRAGLGERNATVGPAQKRYLDVLVAMRYQDPAFASTALKQLNTHLAPWITHGHDKVAEAMLTLLAKDLPIDVRRDAEFAVVKLRVSRVLGEHGRLTAAGLAVPKRLDPALAAAAKQLYALQDGVRETDAFLVEVRAVVQSIVTHYALLGYDAAAVQVLAVKGPKAVASADAWAQLQLAQRQFEKAREELAQLVKQYGVAERITLTPAFRRTIEAYTTFITTHASRPSADEAAQRIFEVAKVFEGHKAWRVASGVYAEFARFAGGVKRLRDAAPGTASTVERAAYHAVLALEQHARRDLDEARAEAPKDAPPPAKLSDAFAETLKGYNTFLATYPRSTLAGNAVRQIQTVALVYAGRDAWDVADGIFAGLIAEVKTLARPERFAFARGLCRLGKVMPDHAREELTALVTGRRPKTTRRRTSQRTTSQQKPARPLLSDAEIARREKAIDAAYAVFKEIIARHGKTSVAADARREIMTMIAHWRSIGREDKSAALSARYLADHPTDAALATLRLQVARDYLAWASRAVKPEGTEQAQLTEVTKRFERARADLTRFVVDFPKERPLIQLAQWDVAQSWLMQARTVGAFSPTLARGQYVRAATELQRVAARFEDHPNLARIPKMLSDIAEELFARKHYTEAVSVWSALTIHAPTHPLAHAAALRIAHVYEQHLGQPLRAAEVYQEVNFNRGGRDTSMQDAIFNIGLRLKGSKRWIESLHVLENFVDSFPRHAKAGQALTMIGQIHQANEAWTDAIEAYRRVIDEYGVGNWMHDAKWLIAECTINLSRWREAADAYRTYLASYPKGRNAAKARRRIDVLKDLERYQRVADEPGQRKAFDAQFQIATIVRDKLSNPVKAIIEFRKVATKWKDSHLADDALFAVGTTYLKIAETAKAREALLAVATQYATSPLADDALFMVGKTYEEESQRLAVMEKTKQVFLNDAIAQRKAYTYSQGARRAQRGFDQKRIAGLKKAGKAAEASLAEAQSAANSAAFDRANVFVAAERARQEVQRLTAAQLADRQDKINAALRRGLDAYAKASRVAAADKAGDALLRMAVIYDEKLKDAKAAMTTWLEIVRQFSGTAVAENASWEIAQYYERERQYEKAIAAYEAFLRNYRRSPKAAAAQFAIAENFEHLGKWVNAMDAYTNYINNFPKGPLVAKAREQINWIKTYRL